MARIVSVNVGTPRQISVRRGRPMMSSIFKAPVEGPIRVEGINLAGDQQADRRVHGGPEKAVYAYAREDADWWEDVLGVDIANGMFGENLTLEGVDVSGAVIGERWRIGTVELEVCQPRLPCSKLGIRFGDPKMVKRFAQASRPGAYLRIVTEGELGRRRRAGGHPPPGARRHDRARLGRDAQGPLARRPGARRARALARGAAEFEVPAA